MSKTLMVAQREFVENMRTKTFWIGILVAPIGLALFYAVMFLLADKTDKRVYAVLDNSPDQWLSKEIDKTIVQGNIQKLMKAVETQDEKALEEEGQRLLKKIEALPESNPIKKFYTEEIAKIVTRRGNDADPATEAEVSKAFMSLGKKALLDSKLRDAFQDFAQDYLGDSEFERKVFTDLGDDPESALAKKLGKEEVFAYFVIGPDPLKTNEGSKYVCNNLTDFKLRSWYARKATDIIRNRNTMSLKEAKQLTDADLEPLQRKLTFTEKRVSTTGKEEAVEDADKILKYAPIFFVYILWMGVFLAAQMLLTNTVEEKSNRIIEVLLSSVSPTQLMHGKIYGIALTGLTVLGSWAMFAVIGIKLAPHMIEGSANQIASWGLDQIVGNPLYALSFLGYFITGYLFYAAILVALGSVCNSLKEAQNLMQPVVFLLIVPLAVMVPIAMDPNGTIAVVLTYIPLYTPFVMMNRAGGPPEVWEYVASSALILVTLWIAFRGAAKVFRIGVLMTGKSPKIREILRWVRAPVK